MITRELRIAEYEKNIHAIDKELSNLQKRSKIYVMLKLMFFILTGVSCYFIYLDFYWIEFLLLLLFGGLYILVLVYDNRCCAIIEKLKKKKTIFLNEISYFKGDFSVFSTGEEYIDYNHEYSFDLDLFGRDSLYNRINRTITKQGSNALAKYFTKLSFDEDKIKSNQFAIKEIAELNDWRIDFLSNNYLANNIDLFSKKIKLSRIAYVLKGTKLPHFLVILTILSFLLAVINLISFVFPLAFIFIQLILVSFISKPLSGLSMYSNELYKEYSGYLIIMKLIKKQSFESDKLNKIKHKLFEEEINSLEAFSKLAEILNFFEMRCNVLMYFFSNMFFMSDVFLLKKVLKWKSQYSKFLSGWLEYVGEVDALVSFATYAYNNPLNTYPEILNETSENILETENIYHPFLTEDRAVPNSFVVKKRNISIITGANMAGKSTFLRTIGIAYILANTGLSVPAKIFRFSNVSLFSSMRTSDNLAQNISYFNAELLRLEKLINCLKINKYTLVILDEILKGTNSKDKLKGSQMFLDAISKYQVSAIVATHDLELAKYYEENDKYFSNYCFEIEITENIKYSYKIRKGIVQNLNASYLLQTLLSKT